MLLIACLPLQMLHFCGRVRRLAWGWGMAASVLQPYIFAGILRCFVMRLGLPRRQGGQSTFTSGTQRLHLAEC